jgi:thiol-disulfide isomerase/thioredoxin
MKIIETLKDAQSNFENAAKGKIAEHFIKANKPYIPSEYEDIKTYSKNLRGNYLKHVNFNNSTLQSSDFLIQRMLSYVFGMTSNPDDFVAFKLNVDDIANAIKTTSLDYQSTLLEILWNKFVEIDNETMANYVANEYLLPITKQLNNYKLTNKLIVYKNTSIGSLAPNFNVDINSDTNTKKTSSLHNLKGSQNYLVLFWSSSCGHCLEELPKLKTYLDTLPNNTLKVVAIGMEDEPYGWNNEIVYYPNFIHVYGKGKWDNPISNNYGVTATPFFFLLDADKHILAKPDDTETLKVYMKKHL